MVSVEEDLRTRFARSVESVVPDSEPYQRLLRRRRRGTVRRAAGAAGLAAVLVAALLVLPHVAKPGTDGTAGPRGKGHASPHIGQPIASDWVRRLLATPTRGTLDAGYVRGLAATARAERTALDVAPDLSDVSVLFAGDVGAARVALVAFHSSSRVLMNWYVGTRGASAKALLDRVYLMSITANGGIVGLDTEETQTWPGRPTVHLDVLVGLVPSGCAITTAADAAHRNWTSGATVDYVVRPQARTTDWWKVTCGGTVRYEGPVQTAIGAWSYDVRPNPAQLDAAIAGARGTVDRDTASDALYELSTSTLPATGPARVLWGGPLPTAGGVTSPAVLAAEPVSGGWVASFWRRPRVPQSAPPGGQPAPLDIPIPSLSTTDANLGDPGVLFAMRPGVMGTPQVVVLGPPSATSVAAYVAGRRVAQTALANGFGQMNVAGTDPITLRAMDGTGRVLATYVLGHHADDPVMSLNPSIQNW